MRARKKKERRAYLAPWKRRENLLPWEDEDPSAGAMFSRDPIPNIAGTTSGQGDVDRLLFRQWQGKTPQERFANSALGEAVGASPLGDPSGPLGANTWTNRNDQWGEIARNVVTGSSIAPGRLSRVAGVEGEPNPVLDEMYQQARADGSIDPMTSFEEFMEMVEAERRMASQGRR